MSILVALEKVIRAFYWQDGRRKSWIFVDERVSSVKPKEKERKDFNDKFLVFERFDYVNDDNFFARGERRFFFS